MVRLEKLGKKVKAYMELVGLEAFLPIFSHLQNTHYCINLNTACFFFKQFIPPPSPTVASSITQIDTGSSSDRLHMPDMSCTKFQPTA